MTDKKHSSKRRGKSRAKKRKAASRKRSEAKAPALLNYAQMKALSDERRVRILAILCERLASPKEVAAELKEELPQISYHVKVLQTCGLIVLDHEIPRRGAVEHYYRAAVPTLIPPNAWEHLPKAIQKSISLEILQRFFDDAAASMEAGIFGDDQSELNWIPLVLDAAGVNEVEHLARGFRESVLALQINATQRSANGTSKVKDARSMTVFLASFLSARNPNENKKASAIKRL